MAPRDISRLPVVTREDPRRLVGMVRRNDIVRAYEVGVTRREEQRVRQSEARIKETSGLQTVEIRIESGSKCEGRNLSDVPWPRDCVVVAVRRNHRSIIPRGSLVLKARDGLILATQGNNLDDVRKLCTTVGRGAR